nr:hypothetical protein [Candidatus Brocadiales bacterium]
TLIQKNRWLEAQQALNRLSAHCVSLTQNSSFIELQGLLNSAQNQKYKSPEIASWISTFRPGAGQVYAGDIKDGVNAFLLNAAFFYTGWSFIANGAWYELVTTAMIGQRYYLGNRYRARLIAEKNNKSQQEIFQRTMFDYVRRIYCVK